MTSFYTALRTQWTQPQHVAVVHAGMKVTYADLQRRVLRALGFLHSQGLRAGDVLALQMNRELAFLELHLAALAGGMVTLPLNPAYTPHELTFYLDDAKPKLAVLLSSLSHETPVVLASSMRQRLDGSAEGAVVETLPSGHPAVICYTSGTTGRPKGAVISHGNILGTVQGLHQAWRWSAADVLLHALPLFHIHGLFVAQHGALHAGATSIWMDRFDAADALEHMATADITVFMGVPTFYSRLLQQPGRSLPHMRLFTSGSAPLPAQVHQSFSAQFGHTILERYGMTEVGIVLSNPYDGPRRPGTVGVPLPGVSIRICDESGQEVPTGTVGEIRIQGPGVISAYLGLPQKTAEAIVDGWMCSGDLAFLDDDGYIHIVGRARDMIITGGLNVYPVEVEAVLLEHPAVAQAAVVGVADPDWGERVVAAVILTEPSTPVEDIADFCRQRLAGYKCPKRVVVVDDFPRNAMGKVQKAHLRTHLSPPG